MKIDFPQALLKFSLRCAVLFLFGFSTSRGGAVWQWSVPDGEARVFLWVPPDCRQVRGVVFANHNMIEQGILEHPLMRQTLSELNFAEAWAVPYFDATFDFHHGAGEHFERVMEALARQSGYQELCFAPVVPLGHSACATFPWNFAAWNPGRTLAILSVHGDAPQTTLTGNGSRRIDWGSRNIDGIPGLIVIGEYEWGAARLAPAFDFVARHPQTPLAFLADAGRGHFDYADRTVAYLAKFIQKAAAERLPANAPLDKPVLLYPIDPVTGWRMDCWRKDRAPTAPPAPYRQYTGKTEEAFWCFDEEMARMTESIYKEQRGKETQLLSVTDGQTPLAEGCGEPVTPKFIPLADGVSFQLKAAFMDQVPGGERSGNAIRWAGLPAGSSLGRAASGPITLSRIVGPVVQCGPDTFALRFGRAEFPASRRNNDMWILASHPGDLEHKSIVQQAVVRAMPNMEGAAQQITFPEIPDQIAGVKTLHLNATSDSGAPVSYYVREGPAEIEGDILNFCAIPPRTKFPMDVTVVAWQFGRSIDPKLKTAELVARTFHLMQESH